MPRNKRLHFKALDGLRFLAFLPVFIFSFLWFVAMDQEDYFVDLSSIVGKVALNSLDFFFFLSAFLLTSHGLREYKYRDSFNLKNFLVRRVIKIAFPLIVLLVFIFAGYPWIIKVLKLQPVVLPSIKSYLTFFPNYSSTTSKEVFTALAACWSVFMFLQFYVALGIVLKFFKPILMYVGMIMAGLGIIIRIVHLSFDTDWTFDTLAYLTPMGIGIIVAQIVRSETPLFEKIKAVKKRMNTVIYIFFGAIILFGYIVSHGGFLDAIIPVFTSVFFGYVVIEQTWGKASFYKMKENRLMSHLGRISYGLIIYQSIVSMLVVIGLDSLDFDFSSDILKVLTLVASLIMTWIIADVSHSIIERPISMFRKSFKKL